MFEWIPYGILPYISARCSKGEYWDKDKRVCVKCPAGYYQPEASALECIPCEDGGITLTTGTIFASDCKSKSVSRLKHAFKNFEISIVKTQEATFSASNI